MKIVIVGCGRVGASLAELYDRAGHDVVIIDNVTSAFDRLPSTFGGEAIRGDGTDEDALRRAGAEEADLFVALTEGDNRNVMAAQVATEKLAIGQVLAKINDPVRAAAYAELGIATVCRTTMLADSVSEFLGLPPSGVPSMIAPREGHHGSHAHTPLGTAAGGDEATTPAASAAAGTGPRAGGEG